MPQVCGPEVFQAGVCVPVDKGLCSICGQVVADRLSEGLEAGLADRPLEVAGPALILLPEVLLRRALLVCLGECCWRGVLLRLMYLSGLLFPAES